MDDAAFIAAVRDNPRATTREIAEVVGVNVRAADHRLRQLYADDKLDSKRIGNTLIWLPLDDNGEDRPPGVDAQN